eukprot:gene8799-biopygen22660
MAEVYSWNFDPSGDTSRVRCPGGGRSLWAAAAGGREGGWRGAREGHPEQVTPPGAALGCAWVRLLCLGAALGRAWVRLWAVPGCGCCAWERLWAVPGCGSGLCL